MAKKKKVGLNNIALLASVATVLGMSSMVYLKMTRVGDNVLAATSDTAPTCVQTCDMVKITNGSDSDIRQCKQQYTVGDLYNDRARLYEIFRTQVLGTPDRAVVETPQQIVEINRRVDLYRQGLGSGDDTYLNNKTNAQKIAAFCKMINNRYEYKKVCKKMCNDRRIPKPTPMNADDYPVKVPTVTPTAVLSPIPVWWTPTPTPTPTAFQTPQNSNYVEQKEEKENKNKPEKSSVITRQINYARDTLNRILAR